MSALKEQQRQINAEGAVDSHKSKCAANGKWLLASFPILAQRLETYIGVELSNEAAEVVVFEVPREQLGSKFSGLPHDEAARARNGVVVYRTSAARLAAAEPNAEAMKRLVLLLWLYYRLQQED